MATRALQPSEYEIQREVEALRDIRRRSITPGALTIDPDLPNQSPPSSPTRTWPIGSSPSLFKSEADSSSDTSSRSPTDRSSHGDTSIDSLGSDATSATSVTDDPFHLFWVPASVHPEIAPAEFRAFLKEHARTPSGDGADLGRSASSSSTSSLGRKRSMLHRQYQPRENDGVEEEKVIPLRRNRSYLYPNPVPQLTFNDLQRLEQLAEEASENDDISKLRTVLRRSLSLNLSPTAIDRMDNIPDVGDEADSPIIVPPPGQILRRSVRTKIRKGGTGEGGHRFSSTRRGPARVATPQQQTEQRNSSDYSTSDHGEVPNDAEVTITHRPLTFSDDGFTSTRPESFSEEGFIFDAYARDEEEGQLSYPTPAVTTSPPPLAAQSSEDVHTSPSLSMEAPQLPLTDVQPGSLLDAIGSLLPSETQSQQQLLLSPESASDHRPSRTPSPSAEGASQISTPPPEVVSGVAFGPVSPPQQQQQQQQTQQQQQQQNVIPSQAQQPPPPSVPVIPIVPSSTPSGPQRQTPPKAKDKKGIFKWGGDKSSKKGNRDKDKDRERTEKEKEKETGFFGSLFGGARKKQESEYPSSMGGGSAAGREAAQALLGASKSSKNVHNPPLSPGLTPGTNPYARYPIHVERAIYRLSHIKLANPRRPLYEQVLISNLMFWYLGIINKVQSPPAGGGTGGTTPVGQQVGVGSNGDVPGSAKGQGAAADAADGDVDERGRELLREQEQRERAEKERLEKERLEREKELEIKKKESGKRGSLTKVPPGGGGRRAEMPVKGPQYEMQHRVMEQEYNSYNMQGGGPTMGRLAGGPGGLNGVPPGQQHYPRQQQQQPPGAVPQQHPNSMPKLVAPQPTRVSEQEYYVPDGPGQQQPRLPPGAMPPVDKTASWMGQSPTSPVHRSPRAPSPQRPPPSQNNNGHHNGAGGPSPPMQHRSTLSGSHDSYAGGSPAMGMGGGGKLPQRSLSANAVSMVQSNGAKVRKGVSAHAVPSQTQLINGVSVNEEEDVPLAVWQQQRRNM